MNFPRAFKSLTVLAGSILLVWAASLPALAEESANPTLLLVANPMVRGTIFEKSVVLAFRHKNQPAMGVILNKQGDRSLGDWLPDLAGSTNAGQRVFSGGPLSPKSLPYLIHRADNPGNALPILDGVWLGVSPDVLADIVQGEKDPDIRVFQGFAGWAPGQLEAEIRHGLWYILPVEDELLFSEKPELLWPQLIARYKENWI